MVLIDSSAIAQKKKKAPEQGPVPSVKLREAEFYFIEGEKYFMLEDYAKALIYYQKAAEINSNNATVYYKIAEVLSISNKQEDLTKAVTNIEQALKLELKNKYFYLLAAGIHANLGNFDKSALAYEQLLREVPNTEEYLYELAAVYQYANKPDEAIKVYNRAEAYFGINETTSLQKQKIYFEQGKTESAFQEGEKLLNAFPDEERFVMGHAETLSQFGFKDKAIPYLEKFISTNPNAVNASMLLAGLYRDTNRESQARELLLAVFESDETELNSKLIVLSTYAAELNQNKASKQTDAEKEKFAIALLTTLQKQYPNQPNVHVLAGDLYLSTNRNREAQEEYLKAVEAGVSSFEVFQNLLYLEMQLEQFEKVITHSELAMEYYPNQAMVYYFNGIAHYRMKHNKEAILSLQQVKKLSSSNPSLLAEVNGLLGDVYNATKEYEKSDEAYEAALALNPNNDVVLNNYSYYLALRKTNLEKAEKMASQLARNNPDNTTYLDTYAWVLYTREKYKEAKKVMEKVVSNALANATHIEHYGDILFKLGDVENAVRQWEKARNLLTVTNEQLNKKIANRKIYE